MPDLASNPLLVLGLLFLLVIGGSLIFARTTSAVNALVEDGAVLDVAGLGLDARQDFTQLARTVAGGAAGSKSINAG